jgi:hypothetical protein
MYATSDNPYESRKSRDIDLMEHSVPLSGSNKHKVHVQGSPSMYTCMDMSSAESTAPLPLEENASESMSGTKEQPHYTPAHRTLKFVIGHDGVQEVHNEFQDKVIEKVLISYIVACLHENGPH